MARKKYIPKARPLIPLPLVLALGAAGVAIAFSNRIPTLSNGFPKMTITVELNNGNDYSKLPGN